MLAVSRKIPSVGLVLAFSVRIEGKTDGLVAIRMIPWNPTSAKSRTCDAAGRNCARRPCLVVGLHAEVIETGIEHGSFIQSSLIVSSHGDRLRPF